MPVRGSREMIAAVEQAHGGVPANVKYTEMPEAGHMWDQPWGEKPDELIAFMFACKRTPAGQAPTAAPAPAK